MPTLSIRETHAAWTRLLNNLTQRLEAMPHLAADHAAMRAVLEEAEALEAQQAVDEAKLRVTNEKRVELLARGRLVRNRLASGVQSFFGLESQELREFGIAPRPVRRRRSFTKAEKAERLAEEAARAAAQLEAESARKAADQAMAKAAVPTTPK